MMIHGNEYNLGDFVKIGYRTLGHQYGQMLSVENTIQIQRIYQYLVQSGYIIKLSDKKILLTTYDPKTIRDFKPKGRDFIPGEALSGSIKHTKDSIHLDHLVDICIVKTESARTRKK